MLLTDRPEWLTWRARDADRALRLSARRALLAALDAPAIDELLAVSALGGADEAMAAVSLLMYALEEVEPPVPWQGRLAEALARLIPDSHIAPATGASRTAGTHCSPARTF